MPVIYQKVITRSDLKANPDVLYLFGDNEQKTGLGGQAAAMRGEPNAVGIRTKRSPSWQEEGYWNDSNIEENIRKITEDLVPVFTHARKGGIIVIPADGIGTGRASLLTRTPKTFSRLQEMLKALGHVREE